MKKLIYSIIAIAMVFATLALFASAAEPTLTSNSIAYIDFTNGNNANDGQSAATAKKQLMQLNSNGAVSLLKDGGTLVASGKLFVGGDYTFPELASTLYITSNDGTTDYKNRIPENNPACAFKMSDGSSTTFLQDTVIDDIILFQETKTSTSIIISNNSTLVIGEKVVTIGSPYSAEPCYMSLYAEKGSTLIVKSGTFQKITGEGTLVIDSDVKIIEKSTVSDNKKDYAANALYSLGLVKGYDDSGSDFRLENSLNRAESIVQIVRFLGAEQIALNGNYTVPFDDVPDWAVPYIGYAYANGITSGRSATKFDTNGTVDEAQFLTLLLRAMDYSDKDGDFVWSNPYELANKVGLIEHTEATEKYNRGDAFVACSNALSSKLKGGNTVAEKLIKNNVITEKAYGYAKRIADGETIVVACVGDSVTQGTGSSPASVYSYPAQLQKLLGKGFKVVNCGKASSYVMNLDSQYNVKKSSPALWYPNTAEYKKFMESNPEIVIVMLGTNDARSMTDVRAEDDFVSSYKALIAELSSLESVKEMYLSTMIPAPNSDITYQGTAFTLPRLIEDIADELKLPLVRTHEALHDYYNVMLPYNDSVHPTNTTYPALAINFYNEVFGHKKELPKIQSAKDNVVFVTSFGKVDNGGTSEHDSVNSLSLAVAMLKETGGTVVVCAPLTEKAVYLVEHEKPITITSLYGGIDYRETNDAVLNFSGNITLGGDTTFDSIILNETANALAINCCYNNLTIGEDVECTTANPAHVLPSINFGYRIGSSALTVEDVSCHSDCTLSIAGGKWSLVRGGNMRTNSGNPIGTIDSGVTVTLNILGGEFTYSGVNTTCAVGMNGCEGNVVMNISGGTFNGSVYGIHRTGSNTTGINADFGGNLTMNITGGSFTGNVGLYHTADTPKVNGTAKLIIADKYKSVVNVNDFDKVENID